MLLILIIVLLFAAPYIFGEDFQIWDLILILGGLTLGMVIDYIRGEERERNDERR